MPSESASIMKKAYKELVTLTAKVVFLTEAEEEKVQAEIEIQFGLSPTRTKRMIDNMVKTGRLARHESSKPKLDPSIVVKGKSKDKDEKRVDAILHAKPGAK